MAKVLPWQRLRCQSGGELRLCSPRLRGLAVFDVDNPAAPVRVGGYDTSGRAYGVAVAGGYAYVADDWAGLQVIDVRNPAAPARVGYDAGNVGVACGRLRHVAMGCGAGDDVATSDRCAWAAVTPANARA